MKLSVDLTVAMFNTGQRSGLAQVLEKAAERKGTAHSDASFQHFDAGRIYRSQQCAEAKAMKRRRAAAMSRSCEEADIVATEGVSYDPALDEDVDEVEEDDGEEKFSALYSDDDSLDSEDD